MGRARATHDEQGRQVAEAQGPAPACGAPAQALRLQRAVGNRAASAMLQRTPAATADPRAAAMGEAAIDATVETIARLLKKQVLWSAEEQQIVDIFQRALDADQQLARMTGRPGTPILDRLIFKTRVRVLQRATTRSAWRDTWVNAWDTLFAELEDERLEQFKRIVAHSGRSVAPGENSENFWATLGEQEAIGLFGALKGLSTGAAGVVDLGAWAVTRSANQHLKAVSNVIGTDVTLAEPMKLSDEVAKGFDEMGDMAFGKEKFSQAEKLLPGFSAAEIGNLGGSIIWSLTMMGAGNVAQGGQAKALLTAIDVASKVKSVEDQCLSMAAYLDRKRKQGPLTWAALRDDAEFWRECTKLATAIASAVAMGITSEKGAAGTIKKVLETSLPYLKAGEIAAKIGQIVQILEDPRLKPKEKEEKAGKIVGELISDAFDIVGGAAAKKDKANADKRKAEAERKAVEEARKQVLESVPAQQEMPHMRFGEVDLEPADGPPLELDLSSRRPAELMNAANQATNDLHAGVDPEVHAQVEAAFEALKFGEIPAHPDDGMHRVQMHVDEAKGKPAVREQKPAAEGPVSPQQLRSTHGMPESNQSKFQQFVEENKLIVEVRSTTKKAPEHLEKGAVYKPVDVKAKTIKPGEGAIGATGEEGTVGFFHPSAKGDLHGDDARAFVNRNTEYWEFADKMTKLQKPVDQQSGTHQEIQVAFTADGQLRAVDAQGGLRAITGDHDVWDVRHADGRPLTRAEYETVSKLMQERGMGVLHGAANWWESDFKAANPGKEMSAADRRIKENVEAPLRSGAEAVIRFAPGQAPQLVRVR